MKQVDDPSAQGQLVWSPADPNLGVGLVTGLEGRRVRVRFFRLQADRYYTTRGPERVIVRYQIPKGDRVQISGGEWARVVEREVDPLSALWHYSLDNGQTLPETELVPRVRDVGAKERLATLNLTHPEVVRSRVLGLELTHSAGRPGLAAVLGARALWLPHQIDVASRAIDTDPVRLLLADEVGLGKTVEAALIYAGLRHEGRAARVLILTPETLCIQWLGEIYRKAHELLVLFDEERIEDALSMEPDLSPFEAHQRIVASIDLIAEDEVLAEEAASVDWDLVIVDEAHHLRWRSDGGGNAAYRLVEALSRKTHNLLLLTATPMALDPAEYHALLRLLDPVRFDAPDAFAAVVERVSQIREAGRALSLAVDGQKAIDKKTAALVQKVLADDPEDVALAEKFLALSPASKTRAALAEEVLAGLQERHGLADYVVRNRRGPVGGLPERQAHVFRLEPSPKQDVLIEVGEGVIFELARTVSDPAERNLKLGQMMRALWAAPQALLEILGMVSPSLVAEVTPLVDDVVAAPLDKQGLPTGDTRLRWLVETIRALAPKQKLLVFVESSIAVRSLRESLEKILSQNVAMFHRSLSPRDQDRQVAWFRDSQGPQVMLSTESGGEGRNFQFCNKVVLYDLPWRPATVEQRIGRVDRVGQKHDVEVLVPYFQSGYEAAILKVMQECIGVLDRTVGGIDHQLEYVSDRLAELILDEGKADDWKALYRETGELIRTARERIAAGVDPILDFASFSPQRAQALMDSVPRNVEERLSSFVQRYAEHSRLRIVTKGQNLWGVEGGASAAGREDAEMSYVATFSRMVALDHEEVEFLSFGHPLVEQAFEWARHGHDIAAGLAICRGFRRDGAVFVWHFEWELPEDVPEAAAYFKVASSTFALDEAGNRVPELENLLHDSERPLDRMDAAPLRASLERWRRLVEQNYKSAETMADDVLKDAVASAQDALEERFALRHRRMTRAHTRSLAGMAARSKQRKALEEEHTQALEAVAQEKQRVMNAFAQTRPRLLAVLAVRLMRAKSVSA